MFSELIQIIVLTKFWVKNFCESLSFLLDVDKNPGALTDCGLDSSPGS